MSINDMSNQLLGIAGGSGLKNVDKQALIDIANSADSNSSVLKTNLCNAIGSPTVNAESYNEIIADINTRKSDLATKLTSKGIVASATETLKGLVDKVSNIVFGGLGTSNDIRVGKSAVINGVLTSGTMNLTNLVAGNIKSGVVIDGVIGTNTNKKWYSVIGGTFTTSAGNQATISGLPFSPSKIILTVYTPTSAYTAVISNTTDLYQNGNGATKVASLRAETSSATSSVGTLISSTSNSITFYGYATSTVHTYNMWAFE
jgi:hypothetical protein